MMSRQSDLQYSLNRRIVVSLTGLGLVGFVVFHMLGNLQVFEGGDALNGYASLLRDMPILLWTARVGLFVVAVVHIVLAIQLAQENRRARPVAYAVREYRNASFTSRTMVLSGSLLLVFIVFHLLHLTAGLVDPAVPNRLDAQGHLDVYGKMLHVFRNPLYVAVYVVGQFVLGMHLSHAVSSSLQTLGFEHAGYNGLFKAAGPAVALFVVVGNLSIIVAVFLGLVHT
jgi:succinate dehydrogenase / fumarate reductase cytochrome b subunit